MFARLLLSPQGAEGTESEGDPNESKGSPKGKPDLTAQAAKLAERHGGADVALGVLLSENKEYRDKIKTLESKLPGNGSLVLTEDEADRWRAYQELGKPEDLKKISREHADRGNRLARLERESEITAIERAAGFLPGTLGPIAGDLAFEIKEGTGKDAGSRSVHVKDTDAEGKEKLVAIREHPKVKPYLASLEPSAGPRGTPPRDVVRPEHPPKDGGVSPAMRERLGSGLYRKF